MFVISLGTRFSGCKRMLWQLDWLKVSQEVEVLDPFWVLGVLMVSFQIEVGSFSLLVKNALIMCILLIFLKLSRNFLDLFSPAAFLLMICYPLVIVHESSKYITISEYISIGCSVLFGYSSSKRLKQELTAISIMLGGWIYYHSSNLYWSSNSALARSDLDILCFMLVLIIVLLQSYFSQSERRGLFLQLRENAEKIKKINKQYNELAKRLEDQIAHKEDFILCFSHETRNPMNSLLGNLELAIEHNSNAQVMEYLTNAAFSGEILLQLLNNVLDTGKIECSSSLDINPMSVDIRETLQRSWSVLKVLIQKRNLNHSLTISNRVPKFVLTDPYRLSQMLVNLTSNSTKFTSRGTVSIHIDFLRKDDISEVDYLPIAGSNLRTNSFASPANLVDEQDVSPLVNINPKDSNDLNSMTDDLVQLQEIPFRKMKSLHELKSSYAQPSYRRHSTNIDNIERYRSGYLKVEIFDTGCGITKDDFANLFKKFSQKKHESTRRNIGTGLSTLR